MFIFVVFFVKYYKFLLFRFAIVDLSLFSRYFGDCLVINVEGRIYFVLTYFFEDIYENINYRFLFDFLVCLGFNLFGYEVFL